MVLSIPTQSMDALIESLTDSDVDVTELRFRTDDGIDGINTEFLVSSQMLTHCNVLLYNYMTLYNYVSHTRNTKFN